MSNNVIDFTDRLKKRQLTDKEIEDDELEDLHQISSIIANQVLDMLSEEYGIDTNELEMGPEVIFFFEAFKGLVLKSANHYHPFQDFAHDFFVTYGVKIEEQPDGNYNFVIGETLDEDPVGPANDG